MNHFCINLQLPSLNDYIAAINHNRFTGNTFKANVQRDINVFLYMAQKKKILRPVTEYPCCIYCVWTEKSKMRDVDNVQSSIKYILDALVKAKILQNDGVKQIRGIYHQVEYGKEDKVDVYIIEGKSRLEINI